MLGIDTVPNYTRYSDCWKGQLDEALNLNSKQSGGDFPENEGQRCFLQLCE